jgi:hypothetical protein
MKKQTDILIDASLTGGRDPANDYDLTINLVMSGGFLTNPLERKTYGGWLTTTEYDECIGFLRRLFTDLGMQFKRKALVIMDKEIFPVIDDILNQFPHITGAFNRLD